MAVVGLGGRVTHSVTSYGSGLRNDVVNLCLEFGHQQECLGLYDM